MDNAGLAAGPMMVVKRKIIHPADNIMGLGPRKIFWLDVSDVDPNTDARTAISTIKIDMVYNELKGIIDWGIQLAEIVTSMPMVLQGQMGPSVPDTFSGQQMFANNASTVLRRLARLFCDRIIDPHFRRTYIYLLLYGPDESEKGDFQIDANWSLAMIEQDIQKQELMQFGQMVLEPRYKKDPSKWMNEMLKARHLDPKLMDYDDEEWQQIVEKLSQPPADSSVEVATIRAQAEQMKKQSDEKTKQAELQFEQIENEKQRQFELILKGVEAELEQAAQSGDMKKAMDAIKARLADTVMKLNTQKELAGVNASAKLMSKPPTEPRGKATTGNSWQQ